MKLTARRWILVWMLAMAIPLTACTSASPSAQTPPPSPTATATTEAVDGSVVKDFADVVARNESVTATKQQLDSLAGTANTPTADALVVTYLDYLTSLIESGLVTDADDRSELASAGITFVEEEGMKSPVIDYNFIAAFTGKVSQEMTDFGAFMALDSDNNWASDGEIRISLTRLADRIAKAEVFVLAYPAAAKRDEVISRYRMYLSAFLGGIDNTPLVNYRTRKVQPEFIAAHRYFLRKYPQYLTASVVQTLTEELKANAYAAPYTYSDYEKQEAFQARVAELVTQAVASLG